MLVHRYEHTEAIDRVKEIELTKGYTAKVSDEDYDWLTQWKWLAKVYSGGRVYAARVKTENKKRKMVYMHREILQPREGMVADHIDGDGLNNQRENLREATAQQNGWNKRISSHNTSGIRGVSLDKKTGKWVATIYVGWRPKRLGKFPTKEAAAEAWLEAARKYRGEFVRDS